jgi:hypothetical protein
LEADPWCTARIGEFPDVVELVAELRRPLFDIALAFDFVVAADFVGEPGEKLCRSLWCMFGDEAKRLARMGLSSDALRFLGVRLLRLPRLGDDLFDREGEALTFLRRLGVWNRDSVGSGEADGEGSTDPSLEVFDLLFVFLIGVFVVVVICFFFFFFILLLLSFLCILCILASREVVLAQLLSLSYSLSDMTDFRIVGGVAAAGSTLAALSSAGGVKRGMPVTMDAAEKRTSVSSTIPT